MSAVLSSHLRDEYGLRTSCSPFCFYPLFPCTTYFFFLSLLAIKRLTTVNTVGVIYLFFSLCEGKLSSQYSICEGAREVLLLGHDEGQADIRVSYQSGSC